MATIIEEVRRPGDSAPDPYRYGWRYVEHQRPDGAVEYEQVPLTLMQDARELSTRTSGGTPPMSDGRSGRL